MTLYLSSRGSTVYLIYMKKEDLVLNNKQLLICNKTQPNQTIFPVLMQHGNDGSPITDIRQASSNSTFADFQRLVISANDLSIHHLPA